MIAQLKRAAESKDKLEMIYVNSSSQITQRIVKVLVVNDASIKAYCYTKRKFRIFKLENILSVAPVRHRRGA